MTQEEKLALAKAAIQSLPRTYGLRWTQDSWDYVLFEKRLKVGIALEERPPDPSISGFVVVRDRDTLDVLAQRVHRALHEAGLYDKVLTERPLPYKRTRNRRSLEDDD